MCKIKVSKIKFLQAVVLLIKLSSTHHPFFRWIQIAKKIIAKSKRESDQSKGAPQSRQSTFPNPSRPTGFPTPPNVLAHNGMFVTTQSKHPMFPASRTFNGSENDLSLNYNSISRGKYGAHSPQKTVLPIMRLLSSDPSTILCDSSNIVKDCQKAALAETPLKLQ